MRTDGSGTDEKLGRGSKRKKPKTDFEKELMRGCGTVVAISFLVYGLGLWPWLVFPDYTLDGLTRILGFGAGAGAFIGVVAIRFTGVTGAAGYVGGTLALAAFALLQLMQTSLGHVDPDLPVPEYPEYWFWLLPIVWILASTILAALAYPSGFEDRRRE